MENNQQQREPGKQISCQRNRKGMSQEELAFKTNLSLRTVQRIENGETVPRGDSIRRLADALQISPEELFDWQLREDKNLIALLNLSQLAFLVFPILGVIIPLAIWIKQRTKIGHVDPVGQAILNFQLTWNIAFFSIHGILLLVILINGNVSPFLFHFYGFYLGGLYLYNLILILINTLGKSSSFKIWYKPAIKFLK